MTGHQLGYARGPYPAARIPAPQHDALRPGGCWRIRIDVASGTLAGRPRLEALLDQLRPGDMLTVTRLDRLGRDTRCLAETVEQLDVAIDDLGSHAEASSSCRNHLRPCLPSG